MKPRRRLRLELATLITAAAIVTAPTEMSAQVEPKHHECFFCHDLHGGSYAALTAYPTSEDLCLSCHSEAGPAAVELGGVLTPIPRQEAVHDGVKHGGIVTSCWNCHDHEGEARGTFDNFSLIPKIRTTPNTGDRPVEFTARTGTGSFADGDATYDGICEVCHTATTEHRWDGTVGGHNAGSDCTQCHTHDAGFAGAGGGCTGCHSGPQGPRRAVVAEFDRRSHHVDWSLAGYAAADSIPDSDCETCHDQSQHQQGTVRLKNVDDGTVTAYSGLSTELESFCSACHDSDGASLLGGPPFSDGVAPADVATGWAGSSHAGSGATCGDCHDQGHGSLKVSLLAPATMGATAPAYAEEQEGFCFGCHDADGPASSDVAGVFGRPINWTTNATGGLGNTLLNDRHDVQHAAQSVTGALVECTSCHNPHSDTPTRPWILDPDPTDGHVVGTDWYVSQYQASGDRLSEFCLDCHDGSLAPGTADHAVTPLVDIRTTWLTDGMGQGTGGPGLIPGTGWVLGDVLPCATCHLPHPRVDADFDATNLFSVVDTVTSKDGTTFLPAVYGRKGESTFQYSMSDDTDGTGVRNGGYFCMTCHTRTGMITKGDCWSCHYHGNKF